MNKNQKFFKKIIDSEHRKRTILQLLSGFIRVLIYFSTTKVYFQTNKRPASTIAIENLFLVKDMHKIRMFMEIDGFGIFCKEYYKVSSLDVVDIVVSKEN